MGDRIDFSTRADAAPARPFVPEALPERWLCCSLPATTVTPPEHHHGARHLDTSLGTPGGKCAPYFVTTKRAGGKRDLSGVASGEPLASRGGVLYEGTQLGVGP